MSLLLILGPLSQTGSAKSLNQSNNNLNSAGSSLLLSGGGLLANKIKLPGGSASTSKLDSTLSHVVGAYAHINDGLAPESSSLQIAEPWANETQLIAEVTVVPGRLAAVREELNTLGGVQIRGEYSGLFE